MMQNFSKLILSLLLITLIAVSVFSGCTDISAADDKASADTSEITPTEIGQGGKTFRFEVSHSTESTTVWNVSTEEESIGAALLEVGLIEGDVGEWGLMVKVVNGLKADYSEDGFWWCFFIDGVMAEVGVDGAAIETDKVYAFVHTPA